MRHGEEMENGNLQFFADGSNHGDASPSCQCGCREFGAGWQAALEIAAEIGVAAALAQISRARAAWHQTPCGHESLDDVHSGDAKKTPSVDGC